VRKARKPRGRPSTPRDRVSAGITALSQRHYSTVSRGVRSCARSTRRCMCCFRIRASERPSSQVGHELLKEFHGQPIVTPNRRAWRPDPERLSGRFDRFTLAN
jgi:hypothetical protein